MPSLKLSGRKHTCSCGAALTYSLHEVSSVVLIGCTNRGCVRCFIRTFEVHEALGDIDGS